VTGSFSDVVACTNVQEATCNFAGLRAILEGLEPEIVASRLAASGAICPYEIRI
jgi:hypothetical protein